MNFFKNIYRSAFSPLKVINKEKGEGKLSASIFVVLITALFGSILMPLLYYICYKNIFDISISLSSMILAFLIGFLTWIAACTLFWLLCNIFKKDVSFENIISTWGFSYITNFLCIILYSLIQLKVIGLISFGIFGFLINTIFIMLLIWKAIYFFMEMKFVIKTTAFELFIFTLISGFTFIGLMSLGFSLGIQVPML